MLLTNWLGTLCNKGRWSWNRRRRSQLKTATATRNPQNLAAAVESLEDRVMLAAVCDASTSVAITTAGFGAGGGADELIIKHGSVSAGACLGAEAFIIEAGVGTSFTYLTSTGTTGTVNPTEQLEISKELVLNPVTVGTVTIDLGANDLASPDDKVTLQNLAIHDSEVSEFLLEALTISTGAGSDLFITDETDLQTPVASGTGITFDGGIASDTLEVTLADPGDFDLTLSNTKLTKTLGATPYGEINLVGFLGGHAVLTGNADDNVFDLGGWAGNSEASIVGGVGADKLIGLEGSDNIWNITGANQGNVGTFVFQGVESLTGGTQADSFVFDDGAILDGQIDGGDSQAGTDNTLDFDIYTTRLDFVLQNQSAITGFDGSTSLSDVVPMADPFLNIDAITSGTDLQDRIQGTDLFDATWAVAATSNYLSNAVSLGFSNIEHLQGGILVDTFTVTGSLSGDIDAGDGADTVDIQAGGSVGGDIDGGLQDDSLTIDVTVGGDVTTNEVP
jgi:hypothetical protein